MKSLIKKVLYEQIESQSNFSRLVDIFKENFPEELKPKVDVIKNFVESYVREHGFNIKFLNSCTTGFGGVRTKNQIIICSPANMNTIGDFLYTIFHEIRHEEQMTKLNLSNPLSEYDLDDFESLYKDYWELEMDADRFGKEMVAKLVMRLNIPIEFAKQQFTYSPYIEIYPSLSRQVESQMRQLVHQIKLIKQSGGSYTDIEDHPMIKQYIHRLENFI
jgi:hypothetical protein